jgi:plastocyanin
MKKIVGLLICIFVAISTISIKAEQNNVNNAALMPQPTTAQLSIAIRRGFFDPAIVIIDLPTNVTWTNLDTNPHSIVNDSGEFGSHILDPGDTYSFTFHKQGKYLYHDGYVLQMTGKIIGVNGGNQPPFRPTLSGPASGKKGITYNYTASSGDPEGMQISFYFDWGDNTNSGWTPFVDTGTTVNASHKWNAKGSYVVKVKAKDSYANAESAWQTLEVTMPKSVNLPFQNLLEKLFERFPYIFPILRHAMGY